MASKGLQVVVKFPAGVPLEVQGPSLLHFEQELRLRSNLDVRVVKALKGDDSQLRLFMTKEQRAKL